LLCAPLHLAGVEIIIAVDHPNLRGELAELGLLSNLVRDLRGIFMNGVGERVTLFPFARGHSELISPTNELISPGAEPLPIATVTALQAFMSENNDESCPRCCTAYLTAPMRSLPPARLFISDQTVPKT
jgi:hypothetical protein